MSELERREQALAALGGDVLAAREVPPREVLQMLSVRVESALASELRSIAEAKNVSVSDLVREALQGFVRTADPAAIRLRTWVTPARSMIEQRVGFGNQTGITTVDLKLDGQHPSVTVSR